MRRGNNKKNRKNRNKNKATASATASRDNNNSNNDNNNNKNNRIVGCENTGPSLSDNLAIKALFGHLHSALDDKDTKALDKLLTDKRGDVYGTTLEKIEELSKLASEKDLIIECMTRNPGSTNCDCYVTIMQTLLENFIYDRRTTKGEMDGAIVSSYSLYVAATFESFVENFTDTKIIDIMHEVRYRYLQAMSDVEYEIISNNHDEKGKAELALSSRSSGGSGRTVALTGNKGGIDIAAAVVEPKCLHGSTSEYCFTADVLLLSSLLSRNGLEYSEDTGEPCLEKWKKENKYQTNALQLLIDPDFYKMLISTATNIIMEANMEANMSKDELIVAKKMLFLGIDMKYYSIPKSKGKNIHPGSYYYRKNKECKIDLSDNRGMIKFCARETKEICNCLEERKDVASNMTKLCCCFSCCVKFPTDELKLCGGCVGIQYCSKDCQKKDWYNHTRICKHLNFKRCDKCGKTFLKEQLKSCSRCYSVRYCSKKCQVNDWPLHKGDCCNQNPDDEEEEDGDDDDKKTGHEN